MAVMGCWAKELGSDGHTRTARTGWATLPVDLRRAMKLESQVPVPQSLQLSASPVAWMLVRWSLQE